MRLVRLRRRDARPVRPLRPLERRHRARVLSEPSVRASMSRRAQRRGLVADVVERERVARRRGVVDEALERVARVAFARVERADHGDVRRERGRTVDARADALDEARDGARVRGARLEPHAVRRHGRGVRTRAERSAKNGG